ncbi:50S ribosomal protein L29 [Candidatus Woesearchaeota archaeon]|nr:50S ribosomal protein L29 [Candidatus Woesearchaeota archaeon]
MKFKELKPMSAGDLDNKLSDLRKELMKQNTQRVTGTQLKNSKLIKNLRKDIARILSLKSVKTREQKKEQLK